ncbi:MAG: dUTP diphosphatase [Candidatus Altiarchaeales archaeon]|nr:dUTP diphosphatase [Candidatus Altiarchaeales archaeon]
MQDVVPSLKVTKIFPDAETPTRAHSTDSGLDLRAYRFETLFTPTGPLDARESKEITLHMLDRVLINTGVKATVGPGYEIQIRPRSGLAVKNGLTVLNTPGTIDESYRGPLGVILINVSNTPHKITKGMRIAQMVVCPVVLSPVHLVEDLDVTVRGAGGFGSTGA